MRAAGIQFADQFVVNLHARRREWKSGSPQFLPQLPERNISFRAGKIHQCAAGINQQDLGADARKRHRRALVNFDLQPVGRRSASRWRIRPTESDRAASGAGPEG